MDPVAHTLVGACLAETGLKHRTPLGTLTLVTGANLPDVDAVSYLVSGDVALLVRRGWTHGVLAMAVLPVALTAGMLALDRWRRRHDPDAPPARWRPLLALATLAVLTHPALDWLNNYGVRLLMPFDGRWFYGDAAYIADPWIWLMAATPVVLARSRTRASSVGWLILALAAITLLWQVVTVGTPARLAFSTAILALAAWRLARGPTDEARRIARASVMLLVCYIVCLVAGTVAARREATGWIRAQGLPAERVVAIPVPANPLARDVIVVLPDRYVFALVDWLASPRVHATDAPIRRSGGPAAAVAGALTAPQARGLRNWIRFPAYDVSPLPDGYRVLIQDVRFSRMRRTGIGYMTVDVDGQYRPKGGGASN